MSITDWLQHAGYGGSPEAWIAMDWRNTNSQNGGWMDIEEGLERCRWRMGRQVQFVMRWVQGIDVMRLQ